LICGLSLGSVFLWFGLSSFTASYSEQRAPFALMAASYSFAL